MHIPSRWRHNGAMASQITSLTIVYSTVYSGAYQRKHQSSESLAFVRGIRRWPVNSPHKWPITRKNLPFGDVIMIAHDTRSTEKAFTQFHHNAIHHLHPDITWHLPSRPIFPVYEYMYSFLQGIDSVYSWLAVYIELVRTVVCAKCSGLKVESVFRA